MASVRHAPLALAASVLFTLPVAAQTAAPHYHVVGRIVVGTTHADFIVADPVNRRLYGLGNTVVDMDQDKVVDSIPGQPAGGYALGTDIGVGLSRTGTLFDLKTAHVLGHINGRGDGSVYDPTTRRAFLFDRNYPRSRDDTAKVTDDTATVVDLHTLQVIGRRHFAQGFESAVADGKGMVFVNREDSSVLTKIDARALKLAARYAIPRCKRAAGLSMDRAHRRLFLGCDKEMVVVNADNGQVVTRIPVSGLADENAFDPGTQLAFSANAPDSTLTIVHEDTPDKYTVVDVVKTGGASRSVAVDERTHKVYAFYSVAGADPKDYRTYVLTAAVLAP